MKSLFEKINKKKATVLVIGLGYVGWPLLNLIKKKKFNVIGLDLNKKLVEKYRKINNLKLLSSYDSVNFDEVDIIIIALPTPLKKNIPDLSYIKNSMKAMINKLKVDQLIILESTSYPSTTENFIVKEINKKFEVGYKFFVGYSPEREDPGNHKFSIKNISKIVSGKTDKCRKLTKNFYQKICSKVVESSSLETAEMTKLYENIFRAVNISLSNETKEICKKINIDFNEVISLASTKPFGFMPFYPGPGVGGHCIPVDPFYLNWYLKKKKTKSKFIELAGKINLNTPIKVFQQIKKFLRSKKFTKKNKILVLGLTYKKNINDLRNSPALKIFQLLIKAKFNVFYNDNYIKKINKNNINYKSVSLKNLNNFDTLILLTDHTYYKKINFKKYKNFIIDTRNFFSKKDNKIIKI